MTAQPQEQTDMLALPIRDLRTGDTFFALPDGTGGDSLAALDSDVVVVRSDFNPEDGPDGPCRVITSRGNLTGPSSATAVINRHYVPRADHPLLVSRRHSLHEALCFLGTTIARKTPVAVTPEEFAGASIVLIDAYLARETLMTMIGNGIVPRKNTYLIGTDSDDTRVWRKAAVMGVKDVVFLPDHEIQIGSLIAASAKKPALKP